MDFKWPPLTRDNLTAIIIALDYYEQFIIETEYNGNPYAIEPDSYVSKLRDLRIKLYYSRSEIFG